MEMNFQNRIDDFNELIRLFPERYLGKHVCNSAIFALTIIKEWLEHSAVNKPVQNVEAMRDMVAGFLRKAEGAR
jgi:hypothetical protein